MFIDEALFKSVPRNALSNKTGMQFISEVPGLELDDFRQIVTIGSADVVIAEKLKLDLNAPVAFVKRYISDVNHRLIFTGETTYRGDVFFMSMRVNPK
jgi:GntR family transcriptional regulator